MSKTDFDTLNEILKEAFKVNKVDPPKVDKVVRVAGVYYAYTKDGVLTGSMSEKCYEAFKNKEEES